MKYIFTSHFKILKPDYEFSLIEGDKIEIYVITSLDEIKDIEINKGRFTLDI